jgi:hypothetical protein
VSIQCGHCGRTHETLNEVRVCAGLDPYPGEGPPTTTVHCGREMTPIIYGLPSFDMHERQSRGEMRLGGCMVSRFSPNWYCPTCDQSFSLAGGPSVGGMASMRMDAIGTDWSKVPDPPWWTKVRMRVQYWITGDV